MQTKKCSKCHQEKPISEFGIYKDNRLLSGFRLRPSCKSCAKAAIIAWRKANPEKERATTAAWRKANPEKVKARVAKWRKANPEKERAAAAAYKKQRRKIDPKFKLNNNISGSIRHSLKGNKAGRHWETIVGFTLKQLIKHIEKQFTEGMSWNNYGAWQIDHRIPISVYNFTKPKHEDFKKAWAIKNLQPMWTEENILKSNKLDKHFQPSLMI